MYYGKAFLHSIAKKHQTAQRSPQRELQQPPTESAVWNGNTISNALAIIYAFRGFYEVLNEGFKKRFLIMYVLMCLVGTGSWLFHMTLLYTNQLFDEFFMVYFMLFNCYFVMEIPHPENQYFFSNKPLFIFLLGFSILFTASYLLWPQPLFHEFVSGTITFWNWYQQEKIISQSGCKSCRRSLTICTYTMFTAFFLWNVDTVFCSTLEDIRLKSPFGFGPLTQFHGWWHILVSVFAHLQVTIVIHSWYDFHKEREEKRKLDVVPGGFRVKCS